MSEGVAGADFTIATIYQEFALLSARYITSLLDRADVKPSNLWAATLDLSV